MDKHSDNHNGDLPIENQEKIREIEEFEKKKKEYIATILKRDIPTFNSEGGVNRIPLSEVIDPKTDLWFSPGKPKPIINEEGLNNIARTAGVIFKDELIEKQSDFNNVQGGQVWYESTAVFPNGETNTESGVANGLNCKDNISKAHMPLMAKKRARSRALLRSPLINLSIFDESEVTDHIIEKVKEQEEEIKKYKEERAHLERINQQWMKKNEKMFDVMKKSATWNNQLIWNIDNIETLYKIREGASNLEQYVVRARIKYLERQQQHHNNN